MHMPMFRCERSKINYGYAPKSEKLRLEKHTFRCLMFPLELMFLIGSFYETDTLDYLTPNN